MQEIPRELIEQMMQQAGIDTAQSQFETEGRYMLRLMQQGKTLREALDHCESDSLREQLRPFMYSMVLASMARVWEEEGRISREMRDDLSAFLINGWIEIESQDC